MAQFHHGISAAEVNSGIIPIRTAATAVIGLVAVASDADASVFPLDTPVLVTSISRALISAGYDGTLRRALEAMQPITNPTMVVIRVANTDPTTVIGSGSGQRTGVHALLTAQSVLGITPKILVAPELETPDVDQALIAVAKKLRAMVYATPRDAQQVMLTTKEAVVTYRDTLAAWEIILIWPEFTSGNVLLDPTPEPDPLDPVGL